LVAVVPQAFGRRRLNFGPGSGLKAALTIAVPTMMARPARIGPTAPKPLVEGNDMDLDAHLAKTPATIDEIKRRVALALERHPLCRNVEFDIVSMPRTKRGGNWTISMRSIAPDAIWEATDIVSDIQEAYDLAAAA
jgi:hypothetical protein